MKSPRKKVKSTIKKAMVKRPIYWEYDQVATYLKDQYQYLRSFKKVKPIDFVVHLGAKNRSSLYNVFKGSLKLNPKKIDLYKSIFMLTQDEVEYLMLMTLRDKAKTSFEKEFWPKKINEFLKKRIPHKKTKLGITKPKQSTTAKAKSKMDEEWEKFLKSNKKRINPHG